MFMLLKFEALKQHFTVDNHLENVDSTLFLRFESIYIYCYR